MGSASSSASSPRAQCQDLAVALGTLHCVQRPHHGVALPAHEGQGEDARVHGQEVQAEEDAAARVAEVPPLGNVVATMRMLSR